MSVLSACFQRRLTLPTRQIVSRLFSVFGAVCVGHLLIVYYYIGDVEVIKFGQYLPLDLFLFEFEKNVPSFFSAFVLVLAGYSLRYVGHYTLQKGDVGAKYWRFLSTVFYFLAADEWFSIHENLNFIENNFLQAPSWLIFYLPLTLLLLVFLIGFIRLLPLRTVVLFGLSGALYVTGAAVFELINAWFGTFHFQDIGYQVFLFFEDGLEMLGVCLFIYSIYDFLSLRYSESVITIPLRTFAILSVLAIIESGITLYIN